MYGWLCGIIFSKLALSTSRVMPRYARTTVAAAQTITTASRLLKIRRSSKLPDFWSKSVADLTTGIVSTGLWAEAMAMCALRASSVEPRRVHTTRPRDDEASRIERDDRCRGRGTFHRERGERGAGVGRHEHVSRLAHQHDPAVGRRPRRRSGPPESAYRPSARKRRRRRCGTRCRATRTRSRFRVCR